MQVSAIALGSKTTLCRSDAERGAIRVGGTPLTSAEAVIRREGVQSASLCLIMPFVSVGTAGKPRIQSRYSGSSRARAPLFSLHQRLGIEGSLKAASMSVTNTPLSSQMKATYFSFGENTGE